MRDEFKSESIIHLADKKYKGQLSESKYHVGDLFSSYELVSPIGEGGFGSVWKCRHIETGEMFAIKILQSGRLTAVSLQRFKDEVYIMKSCAEDRCDLFMPIIETNITQQTKYKKASSEDYYYVMPIASKTGYSILEYKNIKDRISAILNLFDVIQYLHSRGIVHRDIKLDNILLYNEKYILSDYGLVSYQGKKNVTRTRELVGPRSALDNTSYGRIRASKQPFTDICEFAKVIWMILTGQKYSFDGEYNPTGEKALYRNKSLGIYCTKTLDILLEECTQYSRKDRPTITEMRERFEQWWSDNNNSSKQLQLQWDDFSFHLFPMHQPIYAEWINQKDLRSVELTLLQHYPSLLSRKDEIAQTQYLKYFGKEERLELILPNKTYALINGELV